MIRGAVLGFPISHSLSPVLHNAAFEFLGIAGRYEAIEVPSGKLENFMRESSKNFDYLSLTMPLKEEVLGLGYASDPLVERIQSANTLIKKPTDWSLLSTDGSGFLAALHNYSLSRTSSVLILGAGGTARAVVGALDSIVDAVTVLGRSSSRIEALKASMTRSSFEYLPWTNEIDFSSYDLVVNTTPAGAADLLSDSVHKEISATLFDVIYHPWPTVLARRWSDCGGPVISGLELLLYQGVDQLAAALSTQFDREALAAHLRLRLTKAIK
jgi:shikimate dehydrogenase